MKEKMSIHDKAIRLLEGGIVEVDSHSVKLGRNDRLFNPCCECEMDSLCHRNNEICAVCEECDIITGKNNFLELVVNHRP